MTKGSIIMSSAFQALACKIANRHFRVVPATPNCYLVAAPLFAAFVGYLCEAAAFEWPFTETPHK